MPLLSRLSFISLCKETTQGTSASTLPLYVPVKDAQGTENPNYYNDDSLANNSSLVRGVYQGQRDSGFTYNGFLYPEIVGRHLVGCGFADTLTASASSHNFKAPAAGTQPPSWTIGDFDNVTFRQWAGQVIDTLDWTFDAKTGVKQTVKFLGWTSASAATPAAAWPTSAPWHGWQTAFSVGGVATTRLISAGLNIKRSTEVIHTLDNIQGPYNVFAGPLEATLKIQAVVENYTEWNQLINNTQPTWSLTASSATAGVLTINSASSAWVKATIKRGAKFMMLDAEITCIQNATDLGPLQFYLTGGSSAAY